MNTKSGPPRSGAISRSTFGLHNLLLILLLGCGTAPTYKPKRPSLAPDRLVEGKHYAFATYNMRNELVHDPVPALMRRIAVESGPLTDIVVMCHGWNFTPQEGRSLFTDYATVLGEHLPEIRNAFGSARQFNPFFIFVVWHSALRPISNTISACSPAGAGSAIVKTSSLLDERIVKIPSLWGESLNASKVALGTLDHSLYPLSHPDLGKDDIYTQATQRWPAEVADKLKGYDAPLCLLIEHLIRLKHRAAAGEDALSSLKGVRLHAVGHSLGAKLISQATIEAACRRLMSMHLKGKHRALEDPVRRRRKLTRKDAWTKVAVTRSEWNSFHKSVEKGLWALSPDDVLDWGGLSGDLTEAGSANVDDPGRRVWDALPSDVQALLRGGVSTGADKREHEKTIIIEALNKALESEDLYDGTSIRNEFLSKDVGKPFREGKVPLWHVRRLNRWLLETSYPGRVASLQSFVDTMILFNPAMQMGEVYRPHEVTVCNGNTSKGKEWLGYLHLAGYVGRKAIIHNSYDHANCLPFAVSQIAWDSQKGFEFAMFSRDRYPYSKLRSWRFFYYGLFGDSVGVALAVIAGEGLTQVKNLCGLVVAHGAMLKTWFCRGSLPQYFPVYCWLHSRTAIGSKGLANPAFRSGDMLWFQPIVGLEDDEFVTLSGAADPWKVGKRIRDEGATYVVNARKVYDSGRLIGWIPFVSAFTGDAHTDLRDKENGPNKEQGGARKVDHTVRFVANFIAPASRGTP